MYSSFHSSVAIGIILATPLEVGIPLAIASHIVVDTLGERSIGEDWLEKEVIKHFLLLLVGVILGFTEAVVIGIICGSLLDILDKIIFKRLFGDQLIHIRKWYPKPFIQLTTKQTENLNRISILVIIGYMIGLYY